MPSNSDGRAIAGLLLALLAFIPVVRGGHEDWASLTVTAALTLFLSGDLIYHFFTARSLTLKWRRQDWFIAGLIAWMVVTLTRPLSPPDAFVACLQIVTAVIIYYLARWVGASDDLFHKLILGMTACSSFYVVIALLQAVNLLPHSWWMPPHFPASTFVNHNHFAAYLECLFPIALILSWQGHLKPRMAAWAGCGLLGVGLIMSVSRGAWLSLLAAGIAGWLLTAAFQRRKPPAAAGADLTWKKTLFAMLGIFGVFILLLSRPVLHRAMTLLDLHFDLSSIQRVSVWQGTFQLLRENPLLGNGFQSFLYGFPYHRPPGLFRLVDYAHNEYLQLITESGLIALTLLLLPMGFLILRLTRIARTSSTPWKKNAAQGGVIGILAFGFHSVIDFPWHIPASAFQFAAVAGLADSLTGRYDQDPFYQIRFSWKKVRPFKRWIFSGLSTAAAGSILFILITLITADFSSFLARRKQAAGDYESAVQLLEKASARAPFRIQYFRRLGENLTLLAEAQGGESRQKTLLRATEAYRRAVNLAPYDTRSAHGLGMTAKVLGNMPEAGKWLRQAVLRDPNNPLYWKNYGDFLLSNRDAPEAADAYRHAVKLAHPYSFFPETFKGLTDAKHFIEKGDAARIQQQWDDARSFYEIAREFDAHNGEALVGLAVVDLHQTGPIEAEKIIAKITNPRLKSKWFAELAYFEFQQDESKACEDALRTSLELNPANILALQIRLIYARKYQGTQARQKALKQLIMANQPPVVIKREGAADNKLIWEPELGQYEYGEKISRGWALWGKGSIHERIYLPPGKVTFQIVASGTKAVGKGPILLAAWNHRHVLNIEVDGEGWGIYTAETIVRPGESLLRLSFTNDYRDRRRGEDRNLKIDKIIFSWDDLP